MFTCSTTVDGTVFIFWHGRRVTTLTGRPASTFLGKIAGASDGDAQLIMAKVTGNFRRGSEPRVSRGKPAPID